MRSLIIALVLAAFLAAFLPPNAQASESAWITGWSAATTQANATRRPILADFTGSDWCGWCVRLKREVFDTAEFAAWAGRSVVLLEVDFPQDKPQPAALAAENRALAEKHGIEGFPTILLLTPDGRELGRLGYLPGGATAWIAAAERILAKGRQPQ